MKIAGIIKSSLIDYPGKASTVIFLGGCNFRCGYCHNPELVHGYGKYGEDAEDADTPDAFVQRATGGGNEIRREELFAFLKKRKRFLDGVCISGGEPTLNKELPKLAEEIKDLGLSVKLDTNGTRPDMLRELLESGLVDYVAMDVKGPADKYEQIVRCSVNPENIKESARLLTDAWHQNGFPCEFRTTVCRELLSEEDIERMIGEYPGAPAWYLQRFYNPGNILDNSGTYSAYSLGEMEELGRRLCVNVR
ncbi:MAG: anaerobic ribonucleoside-triphosphate reductase activating protein [Anaerovoracaceae bacterium]|jgi:pyruvate formate lyase activating enzyme